MNPAHVRATGVPRSSPRHQELLLYAFPGRMCESRNRGKSRGDGRHPGNRAGSGNAVELVSN
jgi:hypothetical protein